MTVKDVVLSAAAILQADDIESAVGNGDYDDPEVKTLVKCVNLAVAEANTDIPIIKTAYVEATNGFIPFAAFGGEISTVRGVSVKGRAVRFSLSADGIVTGGDGRYEVAYTTAPSEAGAEDRLELGLGVTVDVISYLAARNYCLVTGRTDEASVWDQRYNAEAEKRRTLRRARLPERKWI